MSTLGTQGPTHAARRTDRATRAARPLRLTRGEMAREMADVRAAYAALAPEVRALLRLLAGVHERRLLTPAA